MSIRLAGKFAPNMEDIERTVDQGFDAFEIFLTTKHLEDVDASAKILNEAKKRFNISIVSVHTPHTPEVDLYTERTKSLAKKVGIPIIVFHNGFIPEMFAEDVLRKVEKGMVIENGGKEGTDDLEHIAEVIERGFKICLDVAHFKITCQRMGKDYYSDLETLMKENSEGIGLIHYNDTDGEVDNLGIGEGILDHRKVLASISKYYSGTMIIEVDRDKQGEGKRAVEKILKQL